MLALAVAVVALDDIRYLHALCGLVGSELIFKVRITKTTFNQSMSLLCYFAFERKCANLC